MLLFNGSVLNNLRRQFARRDAHAAIFQRGAGLEDPRLFECRADDL